MITAVDLLRGLGALVGWDRREVEGATGYLDTDYGAKGRAAIECLDRYDVVCVHIEAPDEASHEGRVDAKIEALESIDSKIVGPLHRALRERGPYRLVVTPDHPTPVATKKHSHGLVPVAVCGTGIAADQWDAYHELHAQQSSLRWKEGWRMMGCLMNPQWDGSLAGSV
jgi:2,3-bisphosphoglycerate-independent phosphoglycerate mutase